MHGPHFWWMGMPSGWSRQETKICSTHMASLPSCPGQPMERRTAVITGGGRGVGAAIARALAADNVSVALIGRDVDALEDVAAFARGFGVEATWYDADLANEFDQLRLMRRLVGDFPHLDVLIQSAGIYQSGSFESATIEDLDRHYRVNVRAPYALTRALLPALK